MAQQNPLSLIIKFYFHAGRNTSLAWSVALCRSLAFYSSSSTVSGLNVKIWDQRSPDHPVQELNGHVRGSTDGGGSCVCTTPKRSMFDGSNNRTIDRIVRIGVLVP